MKAHPAEVSVICASISPQGIPITTFQLRYWRPIHSELMTHRVFSRNAGSSRARPSKAIIEQVRNDPWGPLHWGKNEPGMQANQEIEDHDEAIDRWEWAAQAAANAAEGMLDLGLHKQIVNRVLEPFTYIDVVVTATDFANWFALRNHKDAQPEIKDLAARMWDAMGDCHRQKLDPGEWHLPYIMPKDVVDVYNHCKYGRITRDEPSQMEINGYLIKISVARCARVSYKLFDGTNSDIVKDLELYEKLLGSTPLHASPAEHQATPDERTRFDTLTGWTETWANPQLHGNLHGWIQHRKMLPNEYVAG